MITTPYILAPVIAYGLRWALLASLVLYIMAIL